MAGRRARGRGRYRMTPKRRAALRKAQLESAKVRARNAKRKRGLSTRAKVGIGVGVGTVAVLGAGVARHKISGSSLDISFRKKKYTPLLRSQSTHHSTGVRIRRTRTQDPKAGIAWANGVRIGMTDRSNPPFHTTYVGSASARNIGIMSFRYRHQPLTAKSTKEAIFGKPTRSGGAPPQARPNRARVRVDRDTIPHSNPKAQKKWPHIGKEDSRLQNEGVAAGTHYVGPAGVKKYPKDSTKRAIIDERLQRRVLGLGFTVAGETNKMWALPGAPAPERKRRRKAKAKRRRKKKS